MKILSKLGRASLLITSLLSAMTVAEAAKSPAADAKLKAAEAAKEKEETRNPLGCQDIGYKYDMKVLQLVSGAGDDGQALYFFYNKRAEPVYLHQMLKDDSTRTLFLNHEIAGKQWSVLSTSQADLKYICTIDKPKYAFGKIVDCADSIRVCRYANVVYGLNNRGNFWLVKSNTRGGAVADVVRYGIIPQ